MYKKIEELEAKINSAGRNPAQAIDSEAIDVDVANRAREQKNILTLPKSTHFDDDTKARKIPGASNSGDALVGNVAPDYSGYEHILANMKRPKDSSMADLINMGVSTGIGLLGGRGAVGAKIAGEYGLSQAAKREKAEADFEKQLMALNLARANKMATGQKGKVVKGGSSGLSQNQLYKMKYIGHDGLERNYRYVDDKGEPVKDVNDPIANMPTIQYTDRKNSDGSSEQIAKMANQQKTVGGQNADTRITKGPNGEPLMANTRTGIATPMKGEADKPLNLTSGGYTPEIQKSVNKIRDDFVRDTNVNKLEIAHADIRLALDSLPQATGENLLLIRRMLGMATDKGRSLTNEEMANVTGLELGLLNKMQAMGSKWTEGQTTNAIRQAYEKMSVGVERQIQQLYDKKVQQYNDRMKIATGTEYRPEEAFKFIPKYTAKAQMKAVRDVESKAEDLSAGTSKMVEVIDPQGNKIKVPVRYNSETKKWDRVK